MANMIITEREKSIYNSYLRSSRSNRKKPFRYKQNWDKFDETEEYISIQKIDKLFQKHPHFFNNDFFDAPYIIYGTDEYLDLKFYTTQKAISAYLTFTKLRRDQNPDEQLDYLKDSLKFIADFCETNHLFLKDYVNYKSVAQNDCLKHLKEHRVSWYVILEVPGFSNLLYHTPQDEFELYFGELDVQELRNKLATSKKAKELISKGIEKVANYLRNKLNSDKK